VLLRAFCDELARCGLRTACTSPGSRCAPIVLALARELRIACYSHIDERCAAFFALGAAKASGVPTAITSTSGTAAVNLAPAVVEAHHARVPMIVLTADRPPELREVGAGQAIDQLKLYGEAAKWFFEVGIDDSSEQKLRFVRALACRAYWTALAPPSGPVHLNFPLREPLVPAEPLPADSIGREDGKPWVTVSGARSAPLTERERKPAEPRCVIVAGAGSPAGLSDLAARAELPLLADPMSGARRGPAAIAHYDLMLREPSFTDEHRPDLVIRVGELPTSKPLRGWLASLEARQLAVDPNGAWHDPDAVVAERVDVAALPASGGTPGWLESWRAADETVARAIDGELGEELSEPRVARDLVSWLGPEATMFVASSMPVRDLESFAAVLEAPPRVLANRGANGIDGTVSSAFGVAAVSDEPTVLLTGDVALLHDLGGLLAHPRLGLALTIVVFNNDGGGIFHFLPVAGQGDVFEEHVATPHGVDLRHVANLFDCGYDDPIDFDGLRSAVHRAQRGQGATIIEVRTDRAKNLELHRRIARAARDALSLTATATARRA
jgi:2-succinyl-5-enolpyruvyl-6-hydroxy-3-cyclohexene-1-carboxylate synthase